MTRNAEVLDLILRRAGRRKISQTRLLKLTYMADLLAWRVLGAPISEFRYHLYKQGPFDAEFYSALEVLFETGRAEVEEKTTIAGNDCTLIRTVPGDSSFEEKFTRGQIYLADVVIKRYGSMKLPEFLKEVYRTQPMSKAQFGESLSMDMEKNKDRAAVGVFHWKPSLNPRRPSAAVNLSPRKNS